MALDPRAINPAFQCMMAQEAKLATFNGMECKHKQTRGPTSIMVIQEAGYACQMQPKHVS